MHYRRTGSGVSLKMFSRNFEMQNSKFWHVEELLRDQLSQARHNFIVDGEIVYVDNDGKFLPFQAIERKL
jgi:ATP-dependent DNA ligase